MNLKFSSSQKKELGVIIISAVLFSAVLIITLSCRLDIYPIPYYILTAAAYICAGYTTLTASFKNIIRGNVFDENFLMSTASIGAIILGEYPEAIAVMLFCRIGEFFEEYAVNSSRKSISDMMDIAPASANIDRDGILTEVDPSIVEIGDIIVIKAGEKVPVDSVIIEGESELDTSALTGESIPKYVMAGDEIISGCINKNGILKAKALKKYEDSTVSRILELVENAASKKAKSEKFITRFAKYYTPIVVISAVLLALIPTLFFGQSFAEWSGRALLFLVVSCPCALVISVPLSFFGGIGAASKNGILVKGGSYLEMLSKIDTIVFDKTGTLTTGKFTAECSDPHVLELAAYAEHYSAHPISDAIRTAYTKSVDESLISNAAELAGFGVEAEVDGHKVLVGNKKLMEKYEIICSPKTESAQIHVAEDGKCIGSITVYDSLKSGAKETMSQLQGLGVKNIVMLTGDMESSAKSAAMRIGVTDYKAELLPQDKVECVESIMNESRITAYVGDGINDAPVLARADVGIAMGALGSDAAIEAADIVLMDDSLIKIPKAVRISKKTVAIVIQNIVFALGVKGIILILAALGMANMWMAIFGDVGVAMIAILNSMRTLRIGRNKNKDAA